MTFTLDKPRVTTSPTEAQVKLAVSQVLSLPSVYGAPVAILDFKIDDKGTVSGRFRDAIRPRVFSYEIEDDGISFQPFVPGRMDGFNIKVWEDFSEGYTYRIDAVTKRTDKPKCKEGVSYPCGKSCISLNKKCKVDPQDPASTVKRNTLKRVVDQLKTEDFSTTKITDPVKSSQQKEKLIAKKPLKTVGSEFENTGKLMNLPVDSIKSAEEVAPDQKSSISSAAKAISRAGRNWVPVFVKEVKDYEYEVVGNHLAFEAAKKAKLDRVYTIIIDSDPSTLEQIKALTK